MLLYLKKWFKRFGICIDEYYKIFESPFDDKIEIVANEQKKYVLTFRLLGDCHLFIERRYIRLQRIIIENKKPF